MYFLLLFPFHAPCLLYELCQKLKRAFSQQEGTNNNIFRNPAVITTGIVYAGLLAWFTGPPQKSKAIIHFIKYTPALPAKCLIWKYLGHIHFNFLNLCLHIQYDDIILLQWIIPIHFHCPSLKCVVHVFCIHNVQGYRTHFIIYIYIESNQPEILFHIICSTEHRLPIFHTHCYYESYSYYSIENSLLLPAVAFWALGVILLSQF